MPTVDELEKQLERERAEMFSPLELTILTEKVIEALPNNTYPKYIMSLPRYKERLVKKILLNYDKLRYRKKLMRYMVLYEYWPHTDLIGISNSNLKELTKG